jgi:pimeloyl-ACP methyl ester carboxylesterase
VITYAGRVADHSYDELSLFRENIEEWGLQVEVPSVQRFFVAVDGLRQLSGLCWGTGDPQIVLVHGGAQNAHTFDTVALALERPLIALDLPGHGHSDLSPYAPSAISSHADDLARAIEQLTKTPLPLVGMSLGGLCSILVAARRPDLISSLVLLDVTPGVNSEKARHITDFVNGPTTFENFDELLARTVEHNPTRSVSSLRRGILHNAVQRPDGSWVWRHQQHAQSTLAAPETGDLWDQLGSLTMPVTLVRGMSAGSVVVDDDEAEMLARLPGATIVHVEGAGHSIQGDQPVILAELLEQLCF